MTEPDPARVAWDDYLGAITPPPGAATRVRARVDRAIELRSATDVVEPHARARVPRAAAILVFAKSAALSLTIAAGGLATLHLGARAVAEPPARTSTPVQATTTETGSPSPRVAEPAVAPALVPGSAPVITPVIDQPPLRPSVTARAKPPDPAPPSTPDDTLKAETALVRAAATRLARGDARGALAILDEHARRFPSGMLAEERDRDAAIARCRIAPDAREQTLAGFDRSHPRSSYRDRVHEACDGSAMDRPSASQ